MKIIQKIKKKKQLDDSNSNRINEINSESEKLYDANKIKTLMIIKII